MIEIISKSKKNLLKKEIGEICALKDEHWKYGLNKQKTWFHKNVKEKDICNYIKYKNKIIGLTVLRKRTYLINKKKDKYYLFDTLVIKKKFRGKKFTRVLMALNSYIISNENIISLLFCNLQHLKFYKKFGWNILNKKKLKIADYNLKSNGMVFNKFKLNNLKKKNLIFFTKF